MLVLLVMLNLKDSDFTIAISVYVLTCIEQQTSHIYNFTYGIIYVNKNTLVDEFINLLAFKSLLYIPVHLELGQVL